MPPLNLDLHPRSLSPLLSLSLAHWHPNPINPVPLTFKLQPLSGRLSFSSTSSSPKRASELPLSSSGPTFYCVATSETPRENYPPCPQDSRVYAWGVKNERARGSGITMTTWITRFIAFLTRIVVNAANSIIGLLHALSPFFFLFLLFCCPLTIRTFNFVVRENRQELKNCERSISLVDFAIVAHTERVLLRNDDVCFPDSCFCSPGTTLSICYRVSIYIYTPSHISPSM